ncbi:hypothetical protein ABZ815_29470 [Nonomuraea sp. NPDC047529]|uniref:hypothetical protein n=1 Tax=Nonomuraea sp. NPDC047529 TaxID=3155623 RepID=UPI0033ED73AB
MNRMEETFERALELYTRSEHEFAGGHLRLALDTTTEAIVLLRGLTPEQPRLLARALHGAARYLLALDRAAEALPLAREAVELAASVGAEQLRLACAATLAACRRAMDDVR